MFFLLLPFKVRLEIILALQASSEARRRGKGKTIKNADLLLEALWHRFQRLPGAFTAFIAETEPGVWGGRRLGVCVRIMRIRKVCEYFIWENITSLGF